MKGNLVVLLTYILRVTMLADGEQIPTHILTGAEQEMRTSRIHSCMGCNSALHYFTDQSINGQIHFLSCD